MQNDFLCGGLHRRGLLVVGCYLFSVIVTVGHCFAASTEGENAASKNERPYSLVVFRSVDEGTPYEIFSNYLGKRLSNVKYLPTPGSFDTLLKLESLHDPNASMKTYGLGIVQADVLFHYMHGGNPQFPFPKEESSVRAIARLFPEWFHIYAPELLLREQSPSSQLSAFPSACGEPAGTGTLVTSLNVGEILQANWRFELHSCEEQLQQLKFKVLSPSKSTIHATSSNRRLFLMSYPEAQILENAFGEKVYSVVKPEDLKSCGYAATSQAVESVTTALEREDAQPRTTISVDAILVSTKQLPGALIKQVIDIITALDNDLRADSNGGPCAENALQPPRNKTGNSSSNTDEVDTLTSRIQNQTAYGTLIANVEQPRRGRLSDSRVRDLPIAMHPTVKVQQLDSASSRWIVWASKKPLFRAGLVLIVGYFLAAYYVRRKRTREFVRRPHLWLRSTVLLLGFLFFHAIIAILVWLAEYNADTLHPETELATGGLFVALRWLAHYLVLGESLYDLRSDYSVMWLGILRAGYVLSGVFVTVGLGQYAVRRWRERNMKRHVIIVGWNDRAGSVTNELRRQHTKYKIILPTVHAAKGPELGEEEENIVRQGIPEGLVRAGFDTAESVVIVADFEASRSSHEGHVDLWLARTLDDIRQYQESRPERPSKTGLDGQRRMRPYVVVEVTDERHSAMLARLGADEIICVQQFGVELLAQAAAKRKGITDIFNELLVTKRRSNELYFYQLRDDERVLSGTFDRLVQLTMDSKAANIPIGLQRNDESGRPRLLLNPTGGNAELRPGDTVIVLARSNPKYLVPPRLPPREQLPPNAATQPPTTDGIDGSV